MRAAYPELLAAIAARTTRGKCPMEWKGTRTVAYGKKGHGMMYYRGRMHYVHRLAFLALHGRMPKKNALHKCDNMVCCTPSHLKDGDQSENNQDAWDRGRR